MHRFWLSLPIESAPVVLVVWDFGGSVIFFAVVLQFCCYNKYYFLFPVRHRVINRQGQVVVDDDDDNIERYVQQPSL